jgi:hypothetical protein
LGFEVDDVGKAWRGGRGRENKRVFLAYSVREEDI